MLKAQFFSLFFSASEQSISTVAFYMYMYLLSMVNYQLIQC